MQRLQKLFTRVLFTEILSHLIVLNFSFERDIKCKVALKCECQRIVGKGKKAKDAVVGVSQIRYKILYILHSTTNHAFQYFIEEVVSYLFILRISAGALIFLSRLIRFSNFA